jgi:hypothetical protein
MSETTIRHFPHSVATAGLDAAAGGWWLGGVQTPSKHRTAFFDRREQLQLQANP